MWLLGHCFCLQCDSNLDGKDVWDERTVGSAELHSKCSRRGRQLARPEVASTMALHLSAPQRAWPAFPLPGLSGPGKGSYSWSLVSVWAGGRCHAVPVSRDPLPCSPLVGVCISPHFSIHYSWVFLLHLKFRIDISSLKEVPRWLEFHGI